MKNKISIINSSSVNQDLIEEMFSLYVPYHNVDKQFFIDRTINQFTKIVLFRNKHKIVGFCGIRYEHLKKFIKANVAAIYYGQMYIDKRFRGKFLIQKIGLMLAIKYKIMHPQTKIFMWGDTIGYKAYLLIIRSFPEAYPSPDYPITPEIKRVRDFLGQKYYSHNYNKELGVVYKSQNRIKDADAQIKSSDIEDPLIEYYTRINKHHKRGDGILVIIPVTFKNVICTIIKYMRLELKSSINNLLKIQ
ncbi:MAG: hypothetical protein KAR45_15035 [Desulfobacteraceae bacterium]|nr:hypothetical protein [Desulfobacteraceae bacterium]